MLRLVPDTSRPGGGRLQRAALALAERLVDWRPDLFVEALRRRGRDRVAARLNNSLDWRLDPLALPERVVGFEDLAGLFWLSPLNRGAIRQDFDEAALLYRSVRSLEAPHGVEIGRRFGGGTILLAAAVGPRGRVTSIDLAPADDAALDEALERSGLAPRVELRVGDANELQVPGRLDFVLIDGDHSFEGARRDVNRWVPRLREGGLAVFHDMARTRLGATQVADLKALEEALRALSPPPLEEQAAAGSLAVWRRTEHTFKNVY